jgi:lipid-A-disaccharide synthase
MKEREASPSGTDLRIGKNHSCLNLAAVRDQFVYVVAGEVSGDTHGAELLEALREMVPTVQFGGLGGPALRQLSDGAIVDWIDEAGVVGLWEVLRNYRWFKQRFDEVLAEISRIKPDVLLLVDYPGFNLRLARQVHERMPGVKVVHYVAPQVWAWNRRRIPKIAETHDLMLCFFPFEVALFEEAGLRSSCPGHPLVDELEEKRLETERDPGLVGLFPGSRVKEVTRLFPVMLEAVARVRRSHPDMRFVAAAAGGKVAGVMKDLLDRSSLPPQCVEIQTGRSQILMQSVACGVVASGTATLEAAYYGMPYCLVYQVAWPTYLVARQLVKLPHIGLINILAGREVVPEFIQSEANGYEVGAWLARLLSCKSAREELSADLREAASRLGEPGVHGRAAREIARFLSK